MSKKESFEPDHEEEGFSPEEIEKLDPLRKAYYSGDEEYLILFLKAFAPEWVMREHNGVMKVAHPEGLKTIMEVGAMLVESADRQRVGIKKLGLGNFDPTPSSVPDTSVVN